MRTFVLVVLLLFIALVAYRAYARQAELPPGLQEQSLSYDGLERSYYIFVPGSYSSGTPTPLVMVLHGGGGSGRGIANTTHMQRLADEKGFIVVYPNGTGRREGRRLTWNAGMEPPQGYAEKHGIDDVGFVRTLLEKLKSEYTIDGARVYAAGMSKGGMLAYRLACEMSDQFAAIAAVSATLAARTCSPSGPVAILHIHGKADAHVPFAGGKGQYTARGANYPSVMAGIDKWRTVNGCSSQPESNKISNDTTCWTFKGCSSGADVSYCLVEGGGHAWPGAEPKRWQQRRNVYVTQSFSASQKIWDFFAAHAKQSGQ